MNINYKQPQFELFPSNSATLDDVKKPWFLLANLTLSVESLVILLILVIMVGLFSFSLGVECGKQKAAELLDEKINMAWNVGGRKLPEATKSLAVLPLAQHTVSVKGNGGFISTSTKGVVAKAVVAKQKPVVARVKATVAAPALKPIPVGGNYTVQVATYKNESFARKEAVDLKAKGYPTFLIKKGDFWLVCAGRFAAPEAGNVYLKKLQAKYRGSQLRRF